MRLLKVLGVLAVALAVVSVPVNLSVQKAEAVVMSEDNICEKRPCIPTTIITGHIKGQDGNDFAEFMEKAVEAKADGVMVFINSPGGDFDTSARIYTAVVNSPIPVHCIVPVIAASGAFWILQGCTDRAVLPTARLMTHGVYTVSTEGLKLDKKSLLEMLSVMDAMNSIMGAAIAKRMGLSEEYFVSKLENDGDWWFSPTQALKNHAADRIVLTLEQFHKSVLAVHRKK